MSYGKGLRCCLRLRVRICVRHEVIGLLGTCRDALPLRTELLVRLNASCSSFFCVVRMPHLALRYLDGAWKAQPCVCGVLHALVVLHRHEELSWNASALSQAQCLCAMSNFYRVIESRS